MSETWRGMILSRPGRVFSPTARRGSCRLLGIPSPSLALIIPRTTLTCVQRKAELKWLSAQGRKKKLAMSFPTALKQQTFCSVLLTLLSTPPPPFWSQFLHCGVETAKSLEVAFLSSNKKKREKEFFFKVCVRILVKLTKKERNALRREQNVKLYFSVLGERWQCRTLPQRMQFWVRDDFYNEPMSDRKLLLVNVTEIHEVGYLHISHWVEFCVQLHLWFT